MPRTVSTVHRVSLLPSFDGPIHDFSRPLQERAKARKHCGPYHWKPAEPGGGRGFYQSSKGLYCDRSGSIFDLRLSMANEHLDRYSRLARINGYYCDEFSEDTLQPIIARLPRGRGFLAGWTMGPGMFANIDLYVWSDEREAAMEAHNMAERDAERNREANERDRVQEALDAADEHDNDNEEA